MTEIYLLRHGQSTWNVEHRWAGHKDPPLTDLGRLQAKKACSKLSEMGFRWVTSSTLSRARETASIIAGELSLELAPPVLELDERHFGDISGLTSQEIDLPGGEAWADFVERVFQGLCRLSSRPGPILVVSHEGVLRVAEHLLGEKQVRHENLEGKWLRSGNQSLPLA